MKERGSNKLFYDLEKHSTPIDQLCINLLSKISSCIQKIELDSFSEEKNSSSIGLRTINMEHLMKSQGMSSEKKNLEEEKLLSSESLSNLTLEAISPGKGAGSLSGLKTTKIVKPPKPKPPKSTVSKTSLIPPRSYDDTKKKNHLSNSYEQKKHNTVEKKKTMTDNVKAISSLSNVDNLLRRSQESQSDTKQSIYISELHGRVKAMENAVGIVANVTPFGFSNESSDKSEIVITELTSDSAVKTLSAITHKERDIEENKKLKPSKGLINISFAKKDDFTDVDGGIMENKILQINEIQSTLGNIESSNNISSPIQKKQLSPNHGDIWLDSKKVLDTRPLLEFQSCVNKLKTEFTQPDYQLVPVKPFLSKFVLSPKLLT